MAARLGPKPCRADGLALDSLKRTGPNGPVQSFTEAGGLMSYSTDVPQQNRLVASLIDRILRGTAPADLPVVATPTKYETAINITAANTWPGIPLHIARSRW